MIQRESLEKVINEWDPVGLFDMEQPVDSYDPEIAEIMDKAEMYGDDLSVKVLGEIIFEVFVNWFGIGLFESNRKACKKVAKKVMSMDKPKKKLSAKKKFLIVALSIILLAVIVFVMYKIFSAGDKDEE